MGFMMCLVSRRDTAKARTAATSVMMIAGTTMLLMNATRDARDSDRRITSPSSSSTAAYTVSV